MSKNSQLMIGRITTALFLNAGKTSRTASQVSEYELVLREPGQIDT